MKNTIYLIALVVSLGCILFLYQKLTTTEEALHQAEQKFADCQQVTFQLQNQLSQKKR
ncbi:hypothetical protein [Hymenobacter cellulosivorans]|uniref:Uncharacterized protein n=1 Tax=Hymenobacter cellulosivorans TaxID=2932249 RepID=A0ABY4F424_9BACT|nr:hypothetical protein [Hymenobacter cellulosivorans]UOQ51398.1 hypothetical protein MUN80_16710 [Hymenobacter cellulosivorans]